MHALFHRSAPVLLVLFLLILASCNFPGTTPPVDDGASVVPTDPPVAGTPTATIVHLVTPGSGASPESSISDTISGDTARQGVPNEPPGGDMYLFNLYERPFNALTQDIFFPDLDIRSATLGLGSPWMYATIYLYGMRPEVDALAGHYGIEIDLNVDGRGDWLIMADAPLSSEWSTVGVRAWQDTNQDVGQLVACYADPPQVADSYDLLYFDQGIGDDPDAAWARFVTGSSPPAVQIAFKHSMIALDDEFMWGAWTDQGLNQAQWFDYHDHFTLEEAGVPFSGMAEYPIKAIAELDNTCRWAYGFTVDGDEPCLCAGNVATPTVPPERASLGGYVYKDLNGNGVRDEGDGGFGAAIVQVFSGACPGGALVAEASTIEWGRYIVTDLEPGTYCVVAPDIESLVFAPPSYEVTLSAGEFRDNLDFRWPR